MKEPSKQWLIISMLMLFVYGCTDKHIYQVISFKYYDESEVAVEVVLSSGETQHFFCAFPPNTDFSKLKKVAVGKMKSENLLEGTLYYCHIPS